MKKLTLFCAAAVLSSVALSANALPTGYESVNFHATIKVQAGAKIKSVSINDKDLLDLVGTEYDETIPSGAKLVSYGLGSEEFAVLNSDNDVFLANASEGVGGDDYLFYLYSGWEEEYVDQETGSNTYHGTVANAELYYKDSTGVYYLYITGSGSGTTDYDTDDESFSGTGQGNCYLPSGDLKGYGNFGVLTGSMSGSGKDVEDPFGPP